MIVYFVMAMACSPMTTTRRVAARLTETLREWGCWNDAGQVPTSGGITQARQRRAPSRWPGSSRRWRSPLRRKRRRGLPGPVAADGD